LRCYLKSKQVKQGKWVKQRHSIEFKQLQKNFEADRPNQKWVSDITYIATDEGWLYLAVVMDLYSRVVVGWSMSERMTVQLTCDALRMALFRRHRPRGVSVPHLLNDSGRSRHHVLAHNGTPTVCCVSIAVEA